MDEGWSLKSLHRRILHSAACQQSSLAPADAVAARKAHELDPENRLLWRMNTHRLAVGEMRDAWLAATGELDLRTGGKPAELFAGDNMRRTLYTRVDRERLPTVMRTFDFANPDLSIPQRNDTIVPQQALARRTESAGNENAARVRREKPVAWQYGYGELDDMTARVKSFTALPLFNSTARQGGEQWPDKELGWPQLTATGGHPGNDRQHAVVRRWVAPQDGSYANTSR